VRVAAIGWNKVPIREYRKRGRDGAKRTKFYGVRVQEQVTCAYLAEVQHVRIVNADIARCVAKFDTGNLPWQADGLDIGNSSSDIAIDGAVIDSVWEGLDVVAGGSGVDGLSINDVRVSNAFGYGLKLGYNLRNATISGATVTNAGIAGIVVYGPVSGTTISRATIEEVGIVHANGRSFAPWPGENRAGIRVDEGSTGTGAARLTPRGVVIADSIVTNRSHPGGYAFGLLNTGGTGVRALRFHAQGYSQSELYGSVEPR
jgi:hypothetical protein